MSLSKLKITPLKKQLSVIIPVFNEEKTLVPLLKKVLAQKEVLEIIIVDDGSTDGSLVSISSLLKPHVRIFKHKKNQGKGAAIKTGLSKALGKYVIFQDADLELDPSDYKKLLKPLNLDQADFVIGNRWKNNKGFFLPQVGNRILTSLVNILFGTKLSDSYCGYKIGGKDLWEKFNLSSSGFEMEAEIAAKLGILKVRVSEVDVYYNPRTYQDGKKINFKDVYGGIKKLLTLRFKGI